MRSAQVTERKKISGTPVNPSSGGSAYNSSFYCLEIKGGMGGSEESKGGEKDGDGRIEEERDLSNSFPVVSKQSAEHLAVFHAAGRTCQIPFTASHPPRPLTISLSFFFFFFKCVNKSKSRCLTESCPLPQKAPSKQGGGCTYRLTMIAEASPSLSSSFFFFRTFIYSQGVGALPV